MSLASSTVSSAKDRPQHTTTPSSKSRYQRLHHHHHHHREIDVGGGGESSTEDRDTSLRELTASPGTIFRGRGINVERTWTALSTEDATEKERRSDEEEEDDKSTAHQSLVSGLSPNNSREWDDLHDDDDDILRRYHHVIHTRVPTLPAEFVGKEARGNATGIGVKLWAALNELRQGARQRRAARLLNPNSRHDFCQTWFCDATDRGIALAAALTAAWLVLGILTNAKAGYWWTGFFLFVVRVSARSVYEMLLERKRLRKRSCAIPLANAATAAPGNTHALEMAAGNTNGNAKASILYRDQQETPLTSPIV